ncbi:RHS repeat-associated core domain-containing protein [Halomonas cupida]|uniref:RHS repeat-associated core domain-containing protein n=1 Tax=Halomonas cupida TaxID=44933 RepID=UPI003EF8A2B2
MSGAYGGYLGVSVSDELDKIKEELNHNRVIVAAPYTQGETPDAVMVMELEEDDGIDVLDVLIQAAYMLPVVGNVMAIGDVARDVATIYDNDGNEPEALLWAVLVIDAIGLVPAAGNASRPVRVGVREGLMAFARNDGIEIVIDIFFNYAAGAALDFLEELEPWIEQQKPKLLSELRSLVSTLSRYIQNPVGVAEQAGLIDKNPEWWNLLEKGKRIVFIAFDRLLEAFGNDRQRLVGFLASLAGMAESIINGGITQILPLVRELAGAARKRRTNTGGVTHQTTAIAGQQNTSRRGAQKVQTTHEASTPSRTPSGCACNFNAVLPRTTTNNPIDYVMGDENLWHTDFNVPGLVDVEWTRYYRSSIDELDDSELGARWSSPFHLRLETEDDTLTFIDSLNRALPIEPLAVGEQRFLPRDNLTIEHPDADHYLLHYLDGSQERYRHIAESGRGQRAHFRLVEQRQRDGRALTLNYHQGRLESITDGAALELRFNYSAQGLMSQVVRHYPQPEALGGQSTPAHEPEVLVRYTHSDDGDLIESRDIRGYTREYQYQHHLVTRYTHRDGLAVMLEWDWPGKADGALPSAHDARCIRNRLDDGSEDTRFEYHRGLWYTKVTDADGIMTYYRYNYHNQIESITHPFHPELGSEHWRWDEHGRLSRHIDGEGRTSHYRYDDSGRLIEITDPQGLTTRIEYDANGLPIELTEPDGRTRQMRFDERGLPLEETAPNGRITTFEHDQRGLLTAMTDAAGNTYHYAWNAHGRLISASDCSRKTTTFAYDHRGLLTQRRDAAGHVTRYTCDPTGLVLSAQHPDGAVEHFSYNGDGRLTEYQDPTGQRTRYRYNGKGMPVERLDPMGQRFRYDYDRLLRLSALTNHNGDRWQFVYDGGGRLIEETGFDGRTLKYRYDAGGALIERVDGDQMMTFKRDNLGRVLERKTQIGQQAEFITRYGYDLLGRLSRAANPNSETRFHFDHADNLIAEVQRHQLPTGGEYASVTRHTYDVLGHRETTTLPNGQTLAWLRYGSGHVHAMTLDQQELIAFERDDLHRDIRRRQGAQEIHSAYDPVGRLIEQQIRSPQGNAGTAQGRTLTRQWHYSANGLLSQVDDSLRGTTRYGYDPLGRLRQASAPGLEEVFAFDPAGNLIDPPDSTESSGTEKTPHSASPHGATRWWSERRRDHLDGGTEEFVRVGYPGSPKLSQAMGNLLERYAGIHYHYDPHGNLTRRISPNGETWHYQYDVEHRLIEANHYRSAPAAGDDTPPMLRAHYAYDGLGRRIWKRVERAGSAKRNPSEPGYTTLDHTTIELTVFTWDGDLLIGEERFEGRAQTPFDTALRYVPGRQPLELTSENPERPHALPVAQCRYELVNPSLTPVYQANYLFEPESFIPAAKIERHYQSVPGTLRTGTDDTVLYHDVQPGEPTLYYLQTDHLGTPLELTTQDGQLAWVGQYHAWGKLRHTSDGQGNAAQTNNPFRFQGQYHDEETGLHYNRHRYYDPEIGRFTTQDPIGLAGGDNLYVYAPNPTGWVDPLGLSGCNCGDRPPSLSPPGAGRRGAFREAKRQSGVPVGKQPDAVHPNLDRRENTQPGRIYEFNVPNDGGGTKSVFIREDSEGHFFGIGNPQNRGPHFNDEAGNHYDY